MNQYHRILFSLKLSGICMSMALIQSCRKDTGPCANLNRPAYPNELVIGDESAVMRSEINVTLKGIFHENASYFFDIDHDAVIDFEVFHYVSDGGGTGGTPFNGVGMRSLSSDSYFFLEEIDTLFTYTDTFYYALDPVNAAIVRHSKCYDTGYPGTVKHIEENVKYANPGDVVQANGSWANKEIHLLYAPTYYVQEITNEWYSADQDTLWTIATDSARSCEMIPLNAVTYIPIKTSSCGIDRMGWIELELGESTNSILIRESAIQH